MEVATVGVATTAAAGATKASEVAVVETTEILARTGEPEPPEETELPQGAGFQQGWISQK